MSRKGEEESEREIDKKVYIKGSKTSIEGYML